MKCNKCQRNDLELYSDGLCPVCHPLTTEEIREANEVLSLLPDDFIDRVIDDANDSFGRHAHDSDTSHSGVRGHYCPEWDGLWICEDCAEFISCLCYSEAPCDPQ